MTDYGADGWEIINIDDLPPEEFIEALTMCPQAMDDSYRTYISTWQGKWHTFLLMPVSETQEET